MRAVHCALVRCLAALLEGKHKQAAQQDDWSHSVKSVTSVSHTGQKFYYQCE